MDLPPADYILLLNRNETIIPAVVKLNREQICAYFMLGETKGTSAGGAAEAGKNLRVPGTNPFFFTNDALQGNRLLELLDTMPDLEVYVMSTGRVGGGEDEPGSKKVKISHSSAVVQAIVEGSIRWKEDPDFGYFVAAEVPGFDDPELLEPRLLYQRRGRGDEYERLVAQLIEDRRDYLKGFPGLDQSIVSAL
jgi:phosphoenolpyruvate carboxykinase (ATP)